jgi:hypothetical protein
VAVARQLGEELREMLKEFIAFALLQRADSFFDLLCRAHKLNLASSVARRNARPE